MSFALDHIAGLLRTNTYMSKRELFYTRERLWGKNMTTATSTLRDVTIMLKLDCLYIFLDANGLVGGDIDIDLCDGWVSCSVPRDTNTESS